MISTSSYLSLADEEKDADVIVKVTIKRYFLEPLTYELTYDINNCPDRFRLNKEKSHEETYFSSCGMLRF
jgi:hypothetical protein